MFPSLFFFFYFKQHSQVVGLQQRKMFEDLYWSQERKVLHIR